MLPIVLMPFGYAPVELPNTSSSCRNRAPMEQVCSTSASGSGDCGNGSGLLMVRYKASGTWYTVADNKGTSIDGSALVQQQRYAAIERSFRRHSEGFPENKWACFRQMANRICRLPFEDNISSYNPYDETLDSRFTLPGGLSLSLSQLLDDKPEAPVVFSVHRNRQLLVTDEMPLDELVEVLNDILEEEAHATPC